MGEACVGGFRSDDVDEVGYWAEWHFHDHVMLLLPRVGTMRLFIKGVSRCQVVRPGEAIALGPGVSHATATCAARTRHIALYAEAGVAGPLWDSEVPFHAAPVPQRLISVLTCRDMGVRRADLVDRFMFEELAYELPVATARARPSAGLARSVAAHIESAERPGFSIDELAERFAISRRHLTRTFRDEYGSSIHDFIVGTQVTRARRMLSAGERVSTVAFAVGFESPSHFASVFRRVTGISPSDERAHVVSAFPMSDDGRSTQP